MNTLAYFSYLLLSFVITIWVGRRLFTNGRHYILGLLDGDEKLTDFINRTLLSGYYLVNLGYAAVMVRTWKTIRDWPDLLSTTGTMTGRILLTLAILHYCNMGAIILIANRKHKTKNI